MDSLKALVQDVNPGVVLALYLSLTPDIMQRAQAIPGSGVFCLEWPRFLVSLLTRKNAPPAHDWPSTVINVKTGYARTNRSATIEHLLQSHASKPTSRGLTLTFLYTSQPPGVPLTGGDLVGWSAPAIMLVQVVGASMFEWVGASQSVSRLVRAGLQLSVLSGITLAFQRKQELSSARPVKQREVVCVTSGNGSSDAIVVVTEPGGVKLEDIAAARTGRLGIVASVLVTLLLMAWAVLLLTFTTLSAVDAWCVLGVCALGTAHATYLARTWRGAVGLGFKCAEQKTVVHADKVMTALMAAEEVEDGVGLALLPVFFPGPLRPKEEEWWEARKGAAKSV
ncbi:hypothetical protein L226DRAFT_529264 [Lentinus tigrinus ALCF2SS1-7]|uniref:Uncharacterized protein n=1 Tax=Lentinus tigrinus ALCF2SS1-6 TaxID=1328759 RepID=A0A5C2ST93_9APHY|nr:hypothetical protein L227DRAFT_569075 [Lentinus tigrinus ALCF2SS1-6]RPD80806.1 hypothetical protein L226DRAFT_529264 [Lentinus tigrinus ALCF2SS1-7]